MIPKNITRELLIKAIQEIDQEGIPKGRQSRKFLIRFNNKHYPPKYVISLANRLANGFELDSEEFSGGNESNQFLRSLGFEIINVSDRTPVVHKNEQRITERQTKQSVKKHNDRCSDCKNVIIEMFRRIYGTVKIDHKVEIPARLEGFIGESYHKDLSKVISAIENYRGKNSFVRLNNLHRCDLFIPDPGFVVEFDESQHFTTARKISLNNYPSYISLGFDLKKWQDLCVNINAKDNNPEDRDEQRAWYDTLRDFLPLIKGFAPTVRIYMGDLKWCDLDPENSSDLDFFRSKIFDSMKPKPKINASSSRSKNIRIATVTICSDEYFEIEDRTILLKKVVERLKSQVDVILFPAGFYKAKEKPANSLYSYVTETVKEAIDPGSETIICLGVDGRNFGEGSKDQIALALNRNGIISMGRKYHPTDYERTRIQKAPSYLSPEEGYSRIFEVKGKKLFLAVCYDAFGIKQEKLKNPGVDVILNLVHGFYPKGEGGSGDVYFAKNGFAGSSKQWKCPTFGTAVFYDRGIPVRWPTGVLWDRGDMSTTRWKYDYNPLSPYKEIELETKEEFALVRLYKY